MPKLRLPAPAVALTVALLLVACTSAPVGSPSPVPSPSAPPSSPSAPPSEAPSDPPVASPTPSPTPAPTDDPADLTDEEAALVERVRSDARGDAPCFWIRGDDLPDGATAGVECSRNDTTASIIRIFGFPDDLEATRAYVVILDANDVELRSGDCMEGQPGDTSWVPGDGEPGDGIEIDGEFYNTNRSGCYLNDEGLAGAATLCGGGLLVEAFSQDADLEALWDAVDYLPEDAPRDTPSAPGICYSNA
jgi:hypothetical protein